MIELAGVSKRYAGAGPALTVLRDITLGVAPGEFVAIMGPSGSGKSTLLNVLGCLDGFNEGVYRFAGADIGSLGAEALAQLRADRLGFVFQSFNLIAQLDALGNVALPLVYARHAGPNTTSAPRLGGRARRQARRETARRHLDAVGLADRVHHRPAELSGGQRQRVAIARALVNDPDVIIADEPTGNLDSTTGEEIMRLFEALHARGRTILMVTHEPDIAARAGRRITLRDGRIVEDATA